MRAWVLGDPGQLSLVDKPIPMPGRAEVLVRIDAVGICATDLEIIDHGAPAMVGGGEPFNKMFTPGHEYMGTVAALAPGVDEYRIGRLSSRHATPSWRGQSNLLLATIESSQSNV
jgi:L-iditol 2-dehydrogenase